ncbi:MAG TPA: glycosyltransferase family 4 protein, partial [Dehalococcoidia bacterium]|nr:glycosyltransferase family 4 protein [Dehalococcoidia bacterium]
LLFVGGDFARKGGPLLLEAMRRGLARHCDLDVVTAAPVPAAPATTVHTGLGPNDPRLLALYRDADVFVLPTFADCLAVVLAEAMAAALPIVTTRVAAQPEAVRDGESGLIVPPGDGDALGAAIQRLVDDPELRRRFGRSGRAIAEQRFDAHRNADRLLDVVESGIDRWRSQRSRGAVALRKGA